MLPKSKKPGILLVLPILFASQLSYAELSINGQSYAKIGWGDELSQVKDFMPAQKPVQVQNQYYNNNNTYQGAHYQYSSNQYNDSPYNNVAYQPNQNEYEVNNYVAYDQSQHVNRSNYASTNSHAKLFLNLASRSVIVYDIASGKSLYSKYANKARPIASISKLMTAMVLLDAKVNLQKDIRISPFDFKGNKYTKSSGSRLKVGDTLSRKEMLLMTLMKSENPAAKSLARTYPGGYNAFMRAMNKKAKAIGMTNTFFGDPTGLDTRNKASANDLIKLLQAAGRYSIIRNYSTTPNHSFRIRNHKRGTRTLKANNTNKFVRNKAYPISLSKTGYIKESGMSMAFQTNINNKPTYVVVLGASTYDRRNKDVVSILKSLSYRW